MLDQQRRRTMVEHVEGGAGARVDLEQPPALTVDEAIGAGQTGEAGGAGEPRSRLRDLRSDGRRDRPCLVPPPGERTGIAERPQRGGRLPLLGQRQGCDAASVGQEVQGEGAARHPGLEVVAGRDGADGAPTDMRAAAAPGPLQEPALALRDRAGGDHRVRDGEALAQGGEAERILQRGDRLRARAEQAVAGGDLGDEIRRTLEAAAEDDSEGAPRLVRQGVEPRQHAGPVAGAGAEAAGQRTVTLGQRQGVLVAEQVEHERPQTRPAGGLRQRPSGLRGDQDRAALAATRRRARQQARCRAQPAISTASW